MHSTTLSRADRAALENLWTDAGAWVAETWAQLNRQCFDGKLRYQGVVFGLTPHANHLGHTYLSGVGIPAGRITLHSSLLDPRSATVWGMSASEMGDRFASDVLLHEMIHAWILQTGRHDPEERRKRGTHNNEPWCAEVTRIAPLIDLGNIDAQVIKARRVPDAEGKLTIITKDAPDGFLGQGEIARFPHSLRPAGYYARGNGKLVVAL
jgi:hypothetical protein